MDYKAINQYTISWSDRNGQHKETMYGKDWEDIAKIYLSVYSPCYIQSITLNK